MKLNKFTTTITSICLIALFQSNSALSASIDLISNGSFESGDLSGWSTNGTSSGNCPSAPRDWNVSATSSTGCATAANPISGAFAAYNMFDGPAGTKYSLTQQISLDSNLVSADLNWMDSIVGSFGGNRTFSINLYDISGINILETLYSITASNFGNNSWENHSIDILSLLQPFGGNSYLLGFDVDIPSTWTGAAGMGLDNISLMVESAAVPEPSIIALFGLGLVGLGFARRRRQS